MSKFWTQSSLGCVRTYYLRPALNFSLQPLLLSASCFSLTSLVYIQVINNPRESRQSTRNQGTALLNFLVNCLWQEGKILIFSMACSPPSTPCHIESAQNKAQQKIFAAGTQTMHIPPSCTLMHPLLPRNRPITRGKRVKTHPKSDKNACKTLRKEDRTPYLVNTGILNRAASAIYWASRALPRHTITATLSQVCPLLQDN